MHIEMLKPIINRITQVRGTKIKMELIKRKIGKGRHRRMLMIKKERDRPQTQTMQRTLAKESHRPPKPKMQSDSLRKRTSSSNFIFQTSTDTHLQQIFLPINVSNNHWYLAVINAPRRIIQVLDSMGPKPKEQGRPELVTLLNNLYDTYYSKLENIETNWRDVNVFEWEIVEEVQQSMQRDVSSCGLFLLNFMDSWTGYTLSPSFIQEDMQNFR